MYIAYINKLPSGPCQDSMPIVCFPIQSKTSSFLHVIPWCIKGSYANAGSLFWCQRTDPSQLSEKARGCVNAGVYHLLFRSERAALIMHPLTQGETNKHKPGSPSVAKWGSPANSDQCQPFLLTVPESFGKLARGFYPLPHLIPLLPCNLVAACRENFSKWLGYSPSVPGEPRWTRESLLQDVRYCPAVWSHVFMY